MASATQQLLVETFGIQAGWCEMLGSPLYHGLLSHIAEDVSSSGICWKLLEPYAGEASGLALPLRFMAAIHGLVLEGRFRRLAQFYPSAGGTADTEAAWLALLQELELDGATVRERVPPALQTNEVARCCALLPAFLEIFRQTALPLRLLEIGCSGGLNLRWDRYRYESGDSSWGDASSPVVFRGHFVNGMIPRGPTVSIVERRGCDLYPLDPTSEAGRRTLLAFAWPDQPERMSRLANAIEVARRVPATVERLDAVEWLEQRLAKPVAGATTVVFHSIVLPYLNARARDRVRELLSQAGERAAVDAPLAWLSMEAGGKEAEVHLTLWPAKRRRLIATTGYHGRDVELVPEVAHAGEDHRQP